MVTLGEAEIYYSFSSKKPSAGNGLKYSDSIALSSSAKVYFRAYLKDREPSKTITSEFYKLNHNVPLNEAYKKNHLQFYIHLLIS